MSIRFRTLAAGCGTLLAFAANAATPPTPEALALAHLQRSHQALGLTARDVAQVRQLPTMSSRNIRNVRFQQHLDGIDVLAGALQVNVSVDGRILSVDNDFVPDLARRANARAPTLTAAQAVRRAADALGLAPSRGLQLREPAASGDPTRRVVYAGSGLSRRDIAVQLVYVPRGHGPARLAWDLPIEVDDEHYWQLQIDALNGQVLGRRNYVQTHSYRVYRLPYESPIHAPGEARDLVANPENAAASPAGWVTGLVTDGPNVQAQTDIDANNAYTPGTDSKPTGTVDPATGGLVFDYPAPLTAGAATYRDALVVNLFYWNNILHDIFEAYGFDEVNANFEGNDPVLADAQDGLGTNNANFLTLPDGTPGRMQMYLWTPPAEVVVNSPYSASYKAGSAGFGAPLTEAGVTGDLQMVDDGTPPTNDACEDMPPGSLAGKIAFMDRGTCEFGTKMLNAQQAGAIAGVLVNIQADEPVGMGAGAEGGSVTMPSVSIGKSDGNAIKASIAAGDTVNVTLRAGTVPMRDSDFDNGVIVHEYGHGVSNRLAGDGVQAPLCLSGDQQAGEGWSDWWALALTQQTGTEAPGGRGIGTYVSYQPTTGPGIRPFRYSTDMTINPQTYGDLTEGTLSIPHGIGTVWAATLWDMYWALVRGVPDLPVPAPGLGFEPDVYKTGSGKGNTVALQLVLDGLKNGGCNPSMLESRDAILLADQENNGGANQCAIWWAFTRRGMGVNAQSESGDFVTSPGLDVVENFDLPVECSGVCPPPLFRGADRVLAPAEGGCTLTVQWQAAQDNCDTGQVRYDVYRSTDKPFTPSAGSLIAENLDALEFVDSDVEGGQEYHYVVRAKDGAGNIESNLVVRSNVAAGSYGVDPDGILDDAGDTNKAFAATRSPGWTARAAGGVDGSKVWATSASGNYPDDSCLFLESGILHLGDDATLSFDSAWDMEPTWDGGIVEIATAAGGFTNWTKLDDILYPGAMIGEPTFTTSCNNAGLQDGEAAFTGTSNGEFFAFTSDLSPWAGQSVKIRFVFGSDPATNEAGWRVDNIAVDNLRVAEACLDEVTNLAPDAVALAVNSPVREGETAMLRGDLSTDPENQPLQYAWTQVDDGAPFVLLEDADTATPSFVAPGVSMDTDLTFELRVTDVGGLTDTATVVVTVTDFESGTSRTASVGNNRVAGALPGYTLALLALLGLLRGRRLRVVAGRPRGG